MLKEACRKGALNDEGHDMVELMVCEWIYAEDAR